jgi:hypothetical protein
MATITLNGELALYFAVVERDSCRFPVLALLQGFAGWPSLMAISEARSWSVGDSSGRLLKCAVETLGASWPGI